MPKEIQKLAEKIMKNPGRVEIERSKASSSVEQRAYKLLSPQKITLVKKIFKDLDWDSCIIFTSTKRGTDELEKLLKKEGIKAVSIHGDRTQEERNRALQAFKNKEIPVIVATDVLARGIDIKGVSIILNYDVPNSTDDYIHRIGRTGRYDKTGIAITFVTRRDARNFSAIENLKENALKVIQVPESFDDASSFSWGDSSLEGTSGGKQSDGAKPVAEQKKEQKERKEQKEQKEEKQARNRADKKEKKRTGNSSKSTKEREEKVRDDASSGSSSGKRESAKGSTAKGSAAKGSSVPNKSAKEEKVVIPPVLEVASKHNKRFKKPAKGIVGILKSFFQR
jgi:superfamily II DNA/RNA helicase